MLLHTISTGSVGNAYLLKSSKGQVLGIECGVRFSEIKKALDFQISGLQIIVSHVHGDHSKGIAEAVKNGVTIHVNDECYKDLAIKSHNLKVINQDSLLKINGFTIKPFEVKHDVKCFGFLIHHPEMGVCGFVTDTYFVPCKMAGLNNLIIEANFDQEIIDEKLKSDKKFLRDRILKSHLSIEHCLGVLRANDLSQVNNIVLIHLSDGNSHERKFKKLVEDQTGKNVYVAHKNQVIELNKTPF